MSASSKQKNKKNNPMLHLIAGGSAGLVESSICHPLDTIKTRMQLRRNEANVEKAVVRFRSSLMEPALRIKHSLQEPLLRPQASALHEPPMTMTTVSPPANISIEVPRGGFSTGSVTRISTATTAVGTTVATIGPIGTARRIIQREGFMALYKGLSAVYTGIIPKMAIRFVSFEQYREGLNELATKYPLGVLPGSSSITFIAGLGSGLTEAILIVTPAEVCKIRMQSQFHSMVDPSQMNRRKYRNVFQTAFVITREEGLQSLYKGVVPTMLRQGCNQAVNFTAYNIIKREVMKYQGTSKLQSWQSLLIGGLSGGMGPLVNNPLDVVKTRLQRQVIIEGTKPKYTGLLQACGVIARDEGLLALWKGITPRLLRIMPGQAITFMVYEAASSTLQKLNIV